MPIYEFVCESCGHEFEELVMSSSQKITVCPKCNQCRVRKRVSAVCAKPNGKSGGASLGALSKSSGCAPSG